MSAVRIDRTLLGELVARGWRVREVIHHKGKVRLNLLHANGAVRLVTLRDG